jgi:hypothetical protein
MMKVGDLVTLSAKGRRLKDSEYGSGNPYYPEEKYGMGVVVCITHDLPVVQWTSGERCWMPREYIKYAKLPVQRPRGGQ